jgi:CheY-like chemotaxis protein
MGMSSDASPVTDSLATRCVRALMERHGLPRYRQSAWLADATGLSYAQAHRRMNGAAPWTLEELEKVALLFGETLADVITAAEPKASVHGTVRVGDARLPCELWIGSEVQDPRPETVVAVKTSTGWTALCASDVTDQVTYAVERLQARPSAAQRKRIAVLDDDKGITDSICSHLQGSGYEAVPFYASETLLSAFKTQHFDGFVIDWIVGESSTLKLIAAVRAQETAAPILVLTAQVLTGVVDEAEIADAVAHFNLVFSEKPVRMAILTASLARAFATA